jgi:adhesin transport system membrane fusion protein
MSHKTEIEYMNAVEEARALSASTTSRLFLILIAALVVIFTLWASIFEIDELTRGSGQVIPSQERQIIQSLEGGILKELLVKEGDRVEKGQVLLRVSDLAFASEARGGAAQLFALKLKQARLEAEINATDFVIADEVKTQNKTLVENEISLYRSRQEELSNTVAIFEGRRKKSMANSAENGAVIKKETRNLALLNEELRATEKMVASRAMSKLDLTRLKRRVNEVRGNLNEAKEKAVGLQAEINALALEAKQKKDMFRTQALGELGEVKTKRVGLEESLKSIDDVVDRSSLRAPVAGIINAVSIKTIGGVIEPAKPLIEIVPMGDDLKISAKISPNDIAFISLDQKVKVRISAYDAQRYGLLNGQVSRIGASTISDGDGIVYFEVEVETDKNFLGSAAHKLPITPGMLADIDIITGRKTILSYLLRPVLRLKDRAFRER